MSEVDPARSRIMRAVRRERTKPEMVVRRTLHGLGYRFRTNVKSLPGSPDLAFTARRKAIFIHGCFWHRHPKCHLASTPKKRMTFWETKFAGNVERDARKIAELEKDQWEVLTIWECEIRHIGQILPRVVEFLGPPRIPSGKID